MGPTLLLQLLRGDVIDWAAIEALHTPKRGCDGCCRERFKDEFSVLEWSADSMRYCEDCVNMCKERGTPYKCFDCKVFLGKGRFAAGELSRGFQRKCRKCAAQKKKLWRLLSDAHAIVF